MRNLKNSLLAALGIWLVAIGTAGAATLLSFDRPNLIVIIDNTVTYGYYTAASVKPSGFSERERYECTFMFVQVDGAHEITVRTLDRPLDNWDSSPYSEGSIHVNGLEWRIQFSDRPRGCASKFDKDEIIVPFASPGTNLTEYAERGARFRVAKKSKAVGIRWVSFNSIIHRRVKGKFLPTGERLATGTPVVLLREIGPFSEVQYIDLAKDQKIKVWLHSSKLSNPYPRG